MSGSSSKRDSPSRLMVIPVIKQTKDDNDFDCTLINNGVVLHNKMLEQVSF